jgi:NAD(P)-dependent dehydrogenase (short-subunit alcohol dehydrogenase family)
MAIREDGRAAGPIVVVGAAGAVGAAVVRRFLRSTPGAVIAIDRVPMSAELAGHDRVCARVADATSHQALREIGDELRRAGTPPAVLVNCQGLFTVEKFDSISAQSWHRHLDANLTSVFYATSVFVPMMKQAGAGTVVNIASGAGERGSVRPASHYAAAKGGLIAYSKSLAIELAPFGVRVNVVSPGALDTPMFGSVEERRKSAGRSLLNRLGSADDVAAAVEFLASERAGYILGAVLSVSGGAVI